MSVELGKRLKELRESKTELSHRQIAEILKIDRSTYSYYELGKTEPTIATILKLCEIFDVSCVDLLNPAQYNKKRKT